MCKITEKDIVNDTAAVAKAVNYIAAALATTNPTLSAELATAAATLVTATSNWQTGSVIADINDAAQAVEALLGAIPETAPYATFVAITVAALDILIANLSTQPVQTANVVANIKAIEAYVETLPENPYRGAVTIKPGLRGIRHAITSRWNKQVEDQPELKFPKI